MLKVVQELFVAATSSPYLLATKQRMAAISFGVCTGRRFCRIKSVEPDSDKLSFFQKKG